MMPLESFLAPGDDRLLKVWANCIKQAIADYEAPPSKAKVTKKHRRTAEAFLRKHGFIREDGSIGPPLKD